MPKPLPAPPPGSPLLGRPLAILPAALAHLEETIRAGPEHHTRAAEAFPLGTREGRVLVLRLYGPVLSGAPSWFREYGVQYIDPYEIASAVRAAANDKSVTGIVLDVNSPGGVVEGVDEAAEVIREAAQIKPVIASVRDVMGSAAFWLGSGARTILARRTSIVGSIGTFMRWTDYSGMYQESGMQVHVYRSGDMKAPGQSGETHTPEVDETYTALVEDTNAVFLRAVSLGRNVTPQDVQTRWGRGGVWVGEQAVASGVADRLGTLEDALALASASTPSTRGRAATLTPPTGGKDGHPMPPEILALLGLTEDATPEQIKAAIQKREAAAKTAERTSLLAALGVTEEDGKPADLTALKAQAEDGAAYRTALTGQLKAHTITLRGNDDAGQAAAERAAKVWAKADIADLKAEVERLGSEIDTTVPNARISRAPAADKDAPRRPVNPSAYGVR